MRRRGSAPPVTSRNKAQNQSPLRISLLSASRVVARCRKGWAVGPLLCPDTTWPNWRKTQQDWRPQGRASWTSPHYLQGATCQVFTWVDRIFLNVFFGFRLLVTFVRTVFSPTSCLVCFELNRKSNFPKSTWPSDLVVLRNSPGLRSSRLPCLHRWLGFFIYFMKTIFFENVALF